MTWGIWTRRGILTAGELDDVITSSGYRIGPSEIEDALIKHKAVQIAAAIGVPDPVRTEIIKAFIILSDGYEDNEELKEELKNFVRQKLAKHEVPKEIESLNLSNDYHGENNEKRTSK